MIAQLTGKLVHTSPTYTVIDVGGVGYEVRTSLTTFSKIKTRETCTLLIHQYIKGDVHVLYGFANSEEKEWFLYLIHVNSIGPRTALTILSSLSTSDLEQAIISNQTSVLKNIKGIGTKAAQRIVWELKDKIDQTGTGYPTIASDTAPITVEQEALAALIKLGIGHAVAVKSLAKVRKEHPEEIALETLIKQALQVA